MMKPKQTFLLLLMPFFFTACSADIEGVWQCRDDKSETLIINKISKNTYELELGDDITFSGAVNDDGVPVLEMMGNMSRLSISGGDLRFSGVMAFCKDLVKN